jgi:hypothetical protein
VKSRFIQGIFVRLADQNREAIHRDQ